MRQSASDPGQPGDAPAQAAAAGAAAALVDAAGKAAAEKAAPSVQKRATPQTLPIRQYLESTVVPVLMQGLQAMCKERPDNPVEYLAHYLLQHNPQKPAAAAAPAAPAASAQQQPQQQPPVGDGGGVAAAAVGAAPTAPAS